MSAVAENAICWKLKSVNAVSSLVQGIYPRLAPQGSSKTAYIIVDRPPGQTNTQTAQGPAQLIKTPMTVYCIGQSYLESRTIGRQIKLALNPAGVTGTVKWNNLLVDHCIVTQTYDASAPPQVNDEIGYPIEAVDIVLYYLDPDY